MRGFYVSAEVLWVATAEGSLAVRVDGGLSFVSAPMGHGKTLFEVRGGVRIMAELGGWWITNVELYPDALERIAFHYAPGSKEKRARLLDRLRDRYIFCETLDEALHHGVHPASRRRGVAMARLGWDESYAALNAREWDGGRGKSKDDRAELLEVVPMLRKLNVHGYLIAQHEETVDKNMRRICNWIIRVQNQRETVRLLGMRLAFLPPLFLAYYYQSNQAAKQGQIPRAAVTERYGLSWHRKLYDTHGLLNHLAAVDSSITWLGAPLEHAAVSPPRNEAGGVLKQSDGPGEMAA